MQVKKKVAQLSEVASKKLMCTSSPTSFLSSQTEVQKQNQTENFVNMTKKP